MFDVVLSERANKFYQNCDKRIAHRINKAIYHISEQPFIGKNIKKLRGELNGLFRYRFGDYRIVYSADKKIRIISIIWIGKRKDSY